ncbi:MAG TPA: hypothetical protein VIG32_00755 [Candidatus Baltobacteraceae bacterium]
MKVTARAAIAALVLGLAACSGNFGTGTSVPGSVLPPGGGGSPLPYPQSVGSGAPAAQSTAVKSTGDTAVVPITDATNGLQCPALDGYTCVLRFNVPDATPAPAATRGAHAASPSPSPSPSPTPAASPSPASGASPEATATPSGPTMTLKLATLPKDAPAMVHVPAGSLATVALMDVTLTPSADFALDGNAVASFTLPKEQLSGRGFALQLFAVQNRHKKTAYRPIYTFDKSTLAGSTLSFAFRPPKLTVAKGTSYLLVLYGDDQPAATASPSPMPSSHP